MDNVTLRQWVPAAARPQDGDVVVARASARWTIRQVPGTADIVAPSLEEALTLGRRLAEQRSADLWYAELPTSSAADRTPCRRLSDLVCSLVERHRNGHAHHG